MVTKLKVIIWNSESWLIGLKGYFLGDAVSSKEEQQVEERTPFSSSTMTERYIYAFHHQPAWELVKLDFHWAVHYWVPPVHTCDRWRLRRWHTSGSSQHPTEARAPTFHRPSCEFTRRDLTRSQLIPRQIYNKHIWSGNFHWRKINVKDPVIFKFSFFALSSGLGVKEIAFVVPVWPARTRIYKQSCLWLLLLLYFLLCVLCLFGSLVMVSCG